MNHGPYETLVSDGLIISLEELYALLQENITSNIVALVKAIVRKPGLKIESDEFSSSISGGQILVRSGSLVFPDYSIYVPNNTRDIIALDLPDTEGAAYLIVVAEEITSHPYPVKGGNNKEVLAWNSIGFELRSTPAIDTNNEYTLARLDVVDGGWQITDKRYASILKLSGIARGASGEATSIEAQALIVSVSTDTLYQWGQADAEIAGNIVTLDKESMPYDSGYGAVVILNWESEVYAGFIDEPAYYKIELVANQYDEYQPLSTKAPVPQHIIQHSILDDGENKNIIFAIPAVMQTAYDIIVYRIIDPTEQIVEGRIYEGTILAGISEAVTTDITSVISTSSIGINNGIFIEVDQPLDADKYIYQLFINDNSSDNVLADPYSLVYEGPYRKFPYFPSSDCTTISILIRFISLQTTQVISTKNEKGIAVESVPMSSNAVESPIIISAINIDGQAAGGVLHTVADYYSSPEDLVINRAMCSLNQGTTNHYRTDSLWGSSNGAVNNPMADGGIVYIQNHDGTTTFLSFSFDQDGNGTGVPPSPVTILKGTQIKITVQSMSPARCNPVALNIILYDIKNWVTIE